MKKLAKIIIIVVMMITMTGCVKFNANMDIKKDKSMDYSIIYALDTTYFGDEGVFNEEDKKELEKEGFKLEEYNEGNYKGVKLTRKIINIDLVSSKEDAKYSLSGILSSEDKDNNKNDYLFKVEKGLLKNKYKAVLDFDSSDSDLGDMEESSEDYDYSNTTQYDYYTEENTDTTDGQDYTNTTEDSSDETTGSLEDFTMSGMESMDLSFNVTLPYPALSNNATTATNDNKTLKWELSSSETTSIEFEFELYNMTTIYIMIAAGLIVIVAVVVLAIVLIKKKKNPNGQSTVAQSVQNAQATQVAQATQAIQTDQAVVQQAGPVMNQQPTPIQPVVTEQMVQPGVVPTTQPTMVTPATPVAQTPPVVAPVQEAQVAAAQTSNAAPVQPPQQSIDPNSQQ